MDQKYLGIVPYDEDGNFEFVGRNDETWALYDRIIRNEYTVYYAASGEGKSSLIRAGLLPILRRRDFFPVYIVFEDKELENDFLPEAIISNRIKIETRKHNVSYEQSTWSKSRFDAEISEKLKNNLWWLLRNYCFKRGDTELKPLFIFDQFEEVFTKANYNWTDHFFSWLEEISTDYLPDSLQELVNSQRIDMPTQKNFKALFSFRTEYLGDLDYWSVQKHFLPALQENRMCLKPLTPKGAREIIHLNESSLGKYADDIIRGCAEAKADTNNENQPCVYALILSVVCQSLSETSDKERDSLLGKLKEHQDDTVDDILLRFYKKKLKAAGLDYAKNEKIIADIEDALVDEKGKRSRRDTDDPTIKPLSKWIERLCSKENGLLKVIGKKEAAGITVNTIEFPHDRLCKAIDASRKERQGKIAWKLNRQGEWIQFGIITLVVAVIAFMWNALMPSLMSVIYDFGNFDFHIDADLKYSLEEGMATLFLMIGLILYIPLITIFIARKSKKWQILSSTVSLLSFFSFAFLWYRDREITFSSSYVPIFTAIGILGSLVCSGISFLRLKKCISKEKWGNVGTFSSSNWPLWGGYFIFASYLFYECLYRTTFGINEPCDSFWALIALPLLFTMWAWGFFNMTTNRIDKKRIVGVYIASIAFLFLLAIISMLPFYHVFKRSYGFTSSIILIGLWLSVNIYIFLHVQSRSPYYLLSKSKRLFAALLGASVITVTFILNLGYNPMAITPNTVCNVFSWRNVWVLDKDSIGEKRLGVFYASDGDTIIPCCISVNDSLLSKGKYPFYNNGAVLIETPCDISPFANDTMIENSSQSLKWNRQSRKLTAKIPTPPTLEQYLHRKLNKGLSKNSTLNDSIDYYAASLFREMRNANIRYSIEGTAYNLDALGSLQKLDSLQHIALADELREFSLSTQDTMIMSNGWKVPRPRVDVLEDKDLIEFHRELTRSFLLCSIKDRAIQSDMPSMFTFVYYYMMAYFHSVPAMSMHSKFNMMINFNINRSEKSKKSEYEIHSDDILNQRLFAWSDLFHCLCLMDIGCNQDKFIKIFNNNSDLNSDLLNALNELLDELDLLNHGKDHADLISEWHKIYAKLEEINDDVMIKTLAVDQSLRQLKEDVFGTLLPLMKERETGIYNNAFENICKDLVLVAACRGNDIQNDTTELSNYIKEKNYFYDVICEVCESAAARNQRQKKIEEVAKLVNERFEEWEGEK